MADNRNPASPETIDALGNLGDKIGVGGAFLLLVGLGLCLALPFHLGTLVKELAKSHANWLKFLTKRREQRAILHRQADTLAELAAKSPKIVTEPTRKGRGK